MAVMMQSTEHTTRYAAEFERFESQRRGREPSWLTSARRAAMARFVDRGFPTTAEEDWRLTDLTAVAEGEFRRAPRDGASMTLKDMRPFLFAGREAPRLVFINGHFAPELSAAGVENGLRVRNLASAWTDADSALQAHLAARIPDRQPSPAALNLAFFEDGALVQIADAAVVETPIHLLFLSTGDGTALACYPRVLIVAGAGSQACVVETYVGFGCGTAFTNAVSQIVAGQGAVIEHARVEWEAEETYHVAHTHVRLERDSSVTSHSITGGGRLVRNDLHVALDGPGAHCTLNGLFLATGRQHVDNHLRVDHIQPHCDSREFYKGILDGQSRGVFAGRIVVHKDAQKTDAKQTNMNLLLSEHSQVDTKPQLEIFADDVKCTHGATIGQLDEDAMFYLRTRGLPEAAARRLLVWAFAQDLVERGRSAPLREYLASLVSQRLPQGRMGDEA